MHSTEIFLPARRSSLPRLLAWLLAQATAAGLAAAQGERLKLVVEELFTNTIEHGFGGDTEHPVSLALTVTTDGIILRYADHGPPFDPTTAPPLVPDGERVGGFGINLIRSLASALRYERTTDRNVLEMDFRFPAGS